MHVFINRRFIRIFFVCAAMSPLWGIAASADLNAPELRAYRSFLLSDEERKIETALIEIKELTRKAVALGIDMNAAQYSREFLKLDWQKKKYEKQVKVYLSEGRDARVVVTAKGAVEALEWFNRASVNGILSPGGACDMTKEWLGPEKNQGTAKTCVIFTSVGLLEAAHYRAHGEKIALSEASVAREAVSGLMKSEATQANGMIGRTGWPSPHRVLHFAKTGRICEERTLPYPKDTDALGKFDSDVTAPGNSHASVGERKQEFDRIFGADNSEQVKKCRAEGKTLASKFKDFIQCQVRSDKARQLISLGIPVLAGVPESWIKPKLNTGLKHAVVLKGNVREMIPLRNSWGAIDPHVNSELPACVIDHVDPKDGNFDKSALTFAVFTPGDVALMEARFGKAFLKEGFGCTDGSRE